MHCGRSGKSARTCAMVCGRIAQQCQNFVMNCGRKYGRASGRCQVSCEEFTGPEIALIDEISTVSSTTSTTTSTTTTSTTTTTTKQSTAANKADICVVSCRKSGRSVRDCTQDCSPFPDASTTKAVTTTNDVNLLLTEPASCSNTCEECPVMEVSQSLCT